MRPKISGIEERKTPSNNTGVGHSYTYRNGACCKRYDRKNALVAADMLNDVGIPFFDDHELPLERMVTGLGRE